MEVEMFLSVLICLLIAPQRSTGTEDELEFPIDNFGTILVRRASPVCIPARAKPTSCIDRAIYEGIVAGHPDSRVSVYRQDNQIFGTATVGGHFFDISTRLPNTYLLGNFHIGMNDDSNFRVDGRIHRGPAYVVDEVISSGDPPQHLCYTEVSDPPWPISSHNESGIESNAYCRLRLVADHRYFHRIGHRQTKLTEAEMSLLIHEVNYIFRTTVYRDTIAQLDHTGISFKIANITIYDRPTDNHHQRWPHFNARNASSMADMLESFATEESEENAKYCAAILFTGQDFAPCDDLGLAYIGSERRDLGVCAQLRTDDAGRRITPNAAVVTGIRGRRPIARVTRRRVMAHELGHLFGAEHDADDEVEDSPRYLMHYESGDRVTVEAFSPRSVLQQSVVLRYKSRTCFLRPGTCGDFKLDPDEACDEGSKGGLCCTAGCQLKRDEFECSDTNHRECCERCMYAPAGKLCREANAELCRDVARCSGESGVCPRSKPLWEGAPCRDHGRCLAGACVDHCQAIGLIGCPCPGSGRSCEICCWLEGRGCVSTRLVLDDDSPCIDGGVCENGRCVDYCRKIGTEPCICTGPRACTRCCMSHDVCEQIQPQMSLLEGSHCNVAPYSVCRNGTCVEERPETPNGIFGLSWTVWTYIFIVVSVFLLISIFCYCLYKCNDQPGYSKPTEQHYMGRDL